MKNKNLETDFFIYKAGLFYCIGKIDFLSEKITIFPYITKYGKATFLVISLKNSN